jgi:hypothetical protein
METSVQQKSHNNLVVAIINSVQDKDAQNEMLEVSKMYAQVLAGLRIAKQFLAEIDETTGLEHREQIREINHVLCSVRDCEIDLLSIVADNQYGYAHLQPL